MLLRVFIFVAVASYPPELSCLLDSDIIDGRYCLIIFSWTPPPFNRVYNQVNCSSIHYGVRIYGFDRACWSYHLLLIGEVCHFSYNTD